MTERNPLKFLNSERKIPIMDTCNSNDRCCKHIKGIKCDVKNCYYHNAETYCTAEQISVGPQNADTSGDTLCATFKPKEF